MNDGLEPELRAMFAERYGQVDAEARGSLHAVEEGSRRARRRTRVATVGASALVLGAAILGISQAPGLGPPVSTPAKPHSSTVEQTGHVRRLIRQADERATFVLRVYESQQDSHWYFDPRLARGEGGLREGALVTVHGRYTDDGTVMTSLVEKLRPVSVTGTVLDVERDSRGGGGFRIAGTSTTSETRWVFRSVTPGSKLVERGAVLHLVGSASGPKATVFADRISGPF